MSLTVDDLNAARAVWEEWTAGQGFQLSMRVREQSPAGAVMLAGALGARVQASLCVEISVCKLGLTPASDRVMFCQRVPCDPEALRASVAVLARAEWDGGGREEDR